MKRLHLLLEHLSDDRRLRLAFLAAASLFAASYGMHEAADDLHARFYDPGAGELCELVAYQDDELSHLLFFAGFTGIAVVLLAAQAVTPTATSGRDRALIAANATLVAAAIVANLSFEEIGLDLVVVAAVAALALLLALRYGLRPLILYFAASYTGGLVVTAALTMQ
jgi:hypothetical protein